MATSETIQWTYGVVAFLDVLGFSSFVAADAKSSVPVHLERIIAALRDARSSAYAKELEVRAFSDSIVISAQLRPEAIFGLFLAVIDLQRRFMTKGVLIRGGIAFGKHHSSPDAIYSEALIRAYELERDQARFPRVLVDSDLLDWFSNDQATTSKMSVEINSRLLRDRDNLVFLSYLEADILDAHMKLLLSYNVENVTASVLEKLQWLASYHNYCAESLGAKAIVNGSLIVPFQPV